MLGFTATSQLPSILNFARWSSNFARCEIVPQLDAVAFRRPYLPHFSSNSYTVWSVGFLTSWDLKWYIACRKWTSGSSPKVRRKTADAVLYFPYSVFLSPFVLSLHTLNDFDKGLWRSKSWFLHEFELSKAFPWRIYSSPSFLDCFGEQKAIKKHQNLPQNG